jgi:hypothetical protein
MKIMTKITVALALIVLVAACKDRDAEKKIAELESRLAQMEAKNQSPATPAQTPQPAAQPDTKPEGPLPVLSFETVTHDFGTISEGQKVVHTYKFKNTGEAPLIIQSAQPSCGCTVPDWTKDPIPVGGTGFVKAEFDSNGKPGVANKTITVTANTWPKTTQLNFKAMVIGKPTGENGPVK